MAIQTRNAAAVQLLSNDLVQNQGELHLSTIAVNAPYLAAKETVILGTGGAGGIAITLPLAANNYGKVYAIKKVDAGAGAVQVQRNGGDLIDGAAAINLAAQWAAIIIVSDGVSNWYRISLT